MAQCELTIHLENEEGAFRGGETVVGAVEVRADEDVRCEGLTAECRWRTHGKGNSARGEPIRVELFEGEWRAGTVRRYPFEITLPHGPFTYHGHYLNVVWEVRARADLPWAIDPEAEREIAVAPDPQAEPDWTAFLGGPGQVRLLPTELRNRVAGAPETPPPKSGALGKVVAFGCLGLFALPVVALFGATVFQVLQLSRGEAEPLETLIWVVVALGFAGFLGFGANRLFRNWLARKRLGQVTLEAEPRLVRPGEEVRVQVFCQPAKETELVAAAARLEAKEVVTRGSGTDRRTYRHTVHSEATEIAVGRTLPARLPFQTERPVRIPAEAPPSFIAKDNALRWTLTVELDLARWPDWGEERALLVHP